MSDAVSSAVDDRIAWYRNVGGSWTEQTISSDADFATSIVTGDIDGDGRLDVVYAAAFADRVGWFANTVGDGLEFRECPLVSGRCSCNACIPKCHETQRGSFYSAEFWHTMGSGVFTLGSESSLEDAAMGAEGR